MYFVAASQHVFLEIGCFVLRKSELTEAFEYANNLLSLANGSRMKI